MTNDHYEGPDDTPGICTRCGLYPPYADCVEPKCPHSKKKHARDLEAALREARGFVRKRYLAMDDREANELIAHIDAALGDASGEATPDPCPDCPAERGGPCHCWYSNKDPNDRRKPASAPAPSEAPNVGMETFDEQTIDGVRVMPEAPNVERARDLVHEAVTEIRNGASVREIIRGALNAAIRDAIREAKP